MKKDVINFSDFLKDNINSSKIDKEDDFSIPGTIDETTIEDPIEEVENEIDEDIIKENLHQIQSIKENDSDDRYKVFKDRDEMFSCNIELEGVSLENTKVRLVLETKNWNLIFNGDIDSNGKVMIPIKKLSILDESSSGKIRMEVIAEENIFTPWEEDFVVKVSKKVMVRFDEKKNTSNIVNRNKPSVRIIK